jgi:hypothetical protein
MRAEAFEFQIRLFESPTRMLNYRQRGSASIDHLIVAASMPHSWLADGGVLAGIAGKDAGYHHFRAH